jgi:dTDP-4-dehydrorhamnose 3,5-epimerase
MFEKRETALAGCFELQPIVRADSRGQFVKTFHHEYFESNELETDFREQYYSFSRKGVLRGMHFQTPPDAHNKLVYCTAGTILDVVVDVRVGSPTYGEHISLEISASTGNMIYIPVGLAHGFYSKTDATVVYNVGTVYSPDHDGGILWSSIGMDWPDMPPDISERDVKFPTFAEFDSPFKFSV